MQITTVRAERLEGELSALWSTMQRSDATLASPLFRPELCSAAARHRGGVEVAIMKSAGEPIGFFPFFRDGPVGRPFAGRLCDMQGAIVRQGVDWDPRELVAKCGLSAWCFDNLLASQTPFAPYHEVPVEAPYMDLSAGFETYRRERRRAKSDELQNALRKARKLRREIGPVRLELYCRDPQVLDTLLAWKSAQLSKRRLSNALTAPWVLPLFAELMTTQTKDFAGMLSTLHVDGELAAVNVGVRSEHVLHGWVTAYNQRFAKYSPGLLLLVELAQAAPAIGVRRIDMGKGPEPYKRSFASGSVALAEGGLDLRVLHGAAHRSWLRLRERVRQTPIGDRARSWLNRLRYARRRLFDSNLS